MGGILMVLLILQDSSSQYTDEAPHPLLPDSIALSDSLQVSMDVYRHIHAHNVRLYVQLDSTEMAYRECFDEAYQLLLHSNELYLELMAAERVIRVLQADIHRTELFLDSLATLYPILPPE